MFENPFISNRFSQLINDVQHDNLVNFSTVKIGNYFRFLSTNETGIFYLPGVWDRLFRLSAVWGRWLWCRLPVLCDTCAPCPATVCPVAHRRNWSDTWVAVRPPFPCPCKWKGRHKALNRGRWAIRWICNVRIKFSR